ncbi:MAG: hypothetical protein H6558_19100 [Lewinellaceae bacterium]|nr:hypothetical protein [Lewinellaceae bacterium]
MKQLILTTQFVLLTIISLLAQSVPQAFTYQAIARDDKGLPLANREVNVKISILEDSPAGPAVYAESHAVTTNKFGLFVLEVGAGAGSGDFEAIDWENHTYFIQTEFDSGSGFRLSGTGQILSVPYAIVAQRAIEDDVEDADADPVNELQTLNFNSGTGELTISNGNTVTIPAGPGGGTDDQNLTVTGTMLSIENGNTVDLSGLQDGVTDADADPTNEIQTIDKVGNTVTLSDGGGSFTDDVDDADADPANELQELELDGSSLSISGRNSVDLSGLVVPGTDDQNLTFDGSTMLSIENGNTVDLSPLQDGVTDADADPGNEIQTLDFDNNTRELTISGGNTVIIPGGTGSGTDDQQLTYNTGSHVLTLEDGGSVNLSGLIEDDDADPTNELQGLQLSGNTLSIVEGGSGSVTLPSAPTSTSLWKEGSGYIYYDEGDVFVTNSGGDNVVGMGPLTGSTEKGILQIYDNNNTKIELVPSNQDVGTGYFVGANNELNCMITHLNGFPNQGYFAVVDNNGLDADLVPEAGLLVDGNNNGQVLVSGNYVWGETSGSLYIDNNWGAIASANLKQFVMPHPKDDKKEIAYASLEGPEAGAYQRGTAQLADGEAWIPFEEHFELVINPETMTVTLTPLSANTMGLAVVEKTAKGIRVKELMNGAGNFQFDWQVTAIRKGYETYEPVREKRELPKVAKQQEK